MNAYEFIVRMKDYASSGLKRVARSAGVVDDRIRKVGNGMRSTISSSKLFNGVATRLATTLLGLFAISQVMAFNRQIVQTTAKFESLSDAITFSSGRSGAKNIQFLNKNIKDLSLNMEAAYSGYQVLSGSLKGTAIEKEVNSIFDGVSRAATVLKLAPEQVQGAYIALGQIASKGKVQAEELRGQLGERIPGAFNIAARAMGVTQIQLNKMLDRGEVVAEDFLPKFAKELKKTFSPGIAKAVDSLQASINRKKNGLVSLSRALGEKLKPAYKYINDAQAKFYNFVKDNIPLIIAFGGAIAAVAVPMIAATAYTYGMALASKVLTAELRKQFALWLTNPYYWIAIAVVALIGSLIYLYQTNEKVRYAFEYLGGVFKSLYNNFQTWWKGVKVGLSEWWQGVKQVFNAVFGNLINKIKQKYQEIKQGVKDAIAYLAEKWLSFKDWFVGMWSHIKTVVNKVKDWFINAFNAVREKFSGFFDPIIESIKNVIKNVKEKIAGFLKSIKGRLTDWLGIDVDGMIAGLTKMQNGQMKVAKATAGYIKEAHEAGAKAGEKGAAKVRKNGSVFDLKSLLPASLQNAFTDDTGGKTTASGKSIIGGGSKQTHINVTIGKLQDDTKIYVSSKEQGINDLGDKVQEILLRAVNSINQMQTA